MQKDAALNDGYAGDGIIALLGYPYAHEDDAEGAITAGLAITSQIGSLNIKEKISSTTEISLALRVDLVQDTSDG
jgi:hypothetical protein